MSNFVNFEKRFFAGIDIGQVNDWTAISIIERIRAVPALKELHHAFHQQAIDDAKRIPTRLDLVHLERIPLGTLYPKQVDIILSLLRQPLLGEVETYVDLTGVGRGPYDMLKTAKLRRLKGIMITGAQGAATRQPYGWSVGKAELVNNVQIEMQSGRLCYSSGLDLAKMFEKELMDFRASVNSGTHRMTFNAREGENDDLVLSVSYAVFGALRPAPATSIPVEFVK
ncbi:hypothetical protein [Lysobacter enzymogenes]|uniref:hypothetical protein n=1 Tax=Lysobacter enzymogenes TaxID=69 RepID=UPI001A95F4A2|nr:hypothetical protein [Lysobacter enzymogenes]QQP97931.1 hypothetical protein JHW38_07990 [Lysobacter enzymogenes]